MKASTLYRRAAQLVHEGHAYFGCTAIYMLKRNVPMSEAFFRTNDIESLAFARLFQNPRYRDTLYRGCFGKPTVKKNQEHRVMALCLMAAIAEAEECTSHGT